MEDRLTVFEEAGGAVGHQPFALRGADCLTQVGFAGETESYTCRTLACTAGSRDRRPPRW